MSELAVFRDLVRARRRDVGRSQQQLAVALGLHPNVLSHKLNGHGRAILTVPEAIGIVTALAGWGAIDSRSTAEELLAAAGVPSHAVPVTAWSEPPLSLLPERPSTLPPTPHWPRSPEADLGAETGAPGADGDWLARWRLTPPPAQLTRLVGRREARREVAEALASARLVTLTGPGGTGKTRLALQVAADVADSYRDGVGFVDLSPIGAPSQLAGAVAAACGLTSRSADGDEILINTLAGRHVLLVVDNMEHLVESAEVLSHLLQALPGLSLLVTSRVSLRLYGEHIVRVPPLALTADSENGSGPGDAVRLFVERASAAGQRVAETPDELEVVREVCAAVDGLPLAIELAAAKVRVYPPAELLRLLRSRAAVLDSGPRDRPGRQRTLRATLDWSYELLSPSAQRLLACLGVFAGPFDIAGAAAVADLATDAEVEAPLGELIDHSLVERRPGSAGQLALLQTIREYALARLAESGEQDAVEHHNLAHHLAMALRIIRPTDQETSAELAALESAYPNIRVALDHAVRHGAADRDCLDTGLLLANTLNKYWWQRGPVGDGLRYLRALLDVDPDRPTDSLRAYVLHSISALACFGGYYELGATYGRESIAAFESLGDLHGLDVASRTAGECQYAVGQLEEAEALFRQALRLSQERGERRLQGDNANMLGQLLNHQGAHDEARQVLCEAVGHQLTTRSPIAIGLTVHSLTEALRDLGDLRSAELLLHAVLRMSADAGDNRMLASGLEGMAGVASQQGDHGEALRRLGVAQAIRERIGAFLAPVEDATLRRAMASTYTSTTEAERQAVFAEARAVAPLDIASQLLEGAIPVVASGSQDDIAAWIARVVAAQGNVLEA